MNSELYVLFLLGVSSFLVVLLQGIQVPTNFGFKWGLGNRETPKAPTALMGRLERTSNNQLQALALAVPVLLVIILFPAAQSSVTAIGAWLFLLGRFGFILCYVIGIPYLRSVIWGVAMIGWMMMVYGVIVAL